MAKWTEVLKFIGGLLLFCLLVYLLLALFDRQDSWKWYTSVAVFTTGYFVHKYMTKK